VGVEVTSHSYFKHGAAVQSTLGKVRSQISWENRGKFVWVRIGSFSYSIFALIVRGSREKENWR
jgi:hypothetical protein